MLTNTSLKQNSDKTKSNGNNTAHEREKLCMSSISIFCVFTLVLKFFMLSL